LERKGRKAIFEELLLNLLLNLKGTNEKKNAKNKIFKFETN